MQKYIYNAPGWPNLCWDQDRLTPLLSSIRHREGRLTANLNALSAGLQRAALYETLVKTAIQSSDSSDFRLNPAQIRACVAQRLGVEIGASVPFSGLVEALVDITLDATRNFEQPITEELLKTWHRSLVPARPAGAMQTPLGAWRDDRYGPMQLVSGPIFGEEIHFEGPPASQIAGEMAFFLSWVNASQEIDAVVKAGVAHLWFMTIYPFDGATGFIGRAIAERLLARSEGGSPQFFSLSAQLAQEGTAYSEVLERAQKGSTDITAWMEWFLNCVGHAIDRAQVTLPGVFDRTRFWEAYASVPFNQRQRLVIEKILNGFPKKLTTSRWAKLVKCSKDTALSDILDLIAHGVMVRDAGGGRSPSYSLCRPFC